MAISLQGLQYPQPQDTSAVRPGQGTRARIRQDVQVLSTALQSGDLQSAQNSYADLQKLLQSNGAISQGSSPTATAAGPASSAGDALNTIKNDFQALGQALSSGDLAGAQKDFTQLATDSQKIIPQEGSTGKSGGHRHHHHAAPPAAADSQGDSAALTSPPSSTTATAGANPQQQVSAYQYSYQASFESVNNTSNTGTTQAVAFQESFKAEGFSTANTSTDPTSSASQTSAYQYSYQASFQSVSYLG